MATISVLMGIYNCGKTLEEAIDSLYEQTYKDFVLIMCDDGSVDNTYEIANKYSQQHSNIILLRNEKNMGLNYTLNRCLEHAQSKYVARMDGDDLSHPERFQREYDYLETHPDIAIVSCPMEYFDEEGTFRIGHSVTSPKITDFPKSTPFCHAPCMIRTEAIKSVGGYSVGEKLLRVEDYHLWIKLYANGYKGHNLDIPLYKMRDDRNAINRRKWKGDVNEFYVKNLAVSMLKLPFYYRIYSLRPILTHFCPRWLYVYLHKRKNS